MLDLDTLFAADRETAEIETVITAIPDLYGRLMGKRIVGSFFLEEIAQDGMHACDYLFASDMEMEPTPGYDFTSWESGYGDFRAVPDWRTLRQAAWLDQDRPGDLRRARGGARRAGRRRAPQHPQAAARARAGRARPAPPRWRASSSSSSSRRATPRRTRRATATSALSQHYNEDYHLLSGSYAEP